MNHQWVESRSFLPPSMGLWDLRTLMHAPSLRPHAETPEEVQFRIPPPHSLCRLRAGFIRQNQQTSTSSSCSKSSVEHLKPVCQSLSTPHCRNVIQLFRRPTSVEPRWRLSSPAHPTNTARCGTPIRCEFCGCLPDPAPMTRSIARLAPTACPTRS